MVLLHPTARGPQVSCTGLVDFLHLCEHFGHLTKQLPVDGQIWVKHRYSMSGLSFCLVFSIFSHLLLYVMLQLLGTKTGWWMQQVTQICASELVPPNVSRTPNPFLFSRLQISETYIIIAVAYQFIHILYPLYSMLMKYPEIYGSHQSAHHWALGYPLGTSALQVALCCSRASWARMFSAWAYLGGLTPWGPQGKLVYKFNSCRIYGGYSWLQPPIVNQLEWQFKLTWSKSKCN